VVNALAPAEVSKVVLDEENRRSKSSCRRASSAGDRSARPEFRLASMLTAGNRYLTEDEESERRTEEMRTRSKMFIDPSMSTTSSPSAGDGGLYNIEEVASFRSRTAASKASTRMWRANCGSARGFPAGAE